MTPVRKGKWRVVAVASCGVLLPACSTSDDFATNGPPYDASSPADAETGMDAASRDSSGDGAADSASRDSSTQPDGTTMVDSGAPPSDAAGEDAPADSPPGDAGPGVDTVTGYTGSGATPGQTFGGGILNIGRQFHVVDTGIMLQELGVWDNGADGLASSHEVTLFSLDMAGPDAGATPVAGGSVTVPAGTAAPLIDGFRFAPLPSPLSLDIGDYAIVTYGFDAQDTYGLGGNIPVFTTGIVAGTFDPYEWVSAPPPTYPHGGDTTDHSSVSLRYSKANARFTRIMPLGDSITWGYAGTDAGYRSFLNTLLANAAYAHQFVGNDATNTGTLPADQIHEEGHPGWIIQGGTGAPRSGLSENLNQWLGPGGVDPDIVLLMIGTNDVDTNYDLANAPNRLSSLISQIVDKNTGLRPQAHVIVAQITPITDATEDMLAQAYNAQVATVVANHQANGEPVSLVDMHSALNTATDMADKLHPNDSGYSKMAQVWFQAIHSL